MAGISPARVEGGDTGALTEVREIKEVGKKVGAIPAVGGDDGGSVIIRVVGKLGVGLQKTKVSFYDDVNMLNNLRSRKRSKRSKLHLARSNTRCVHSGDRTTSVLLYPGTPLTNPRQRLTIVLSFFLPFLPWSSCPCSLALLLT